MASSRFDVPLTVIVFAVFSAGAFAQSSCTTVLVSLSPCLDYITGNSSTPSSACCTQLANVVRSQPQCLCEALNSNASSSLGINIDQTRAMQLPSACNVQTPPVSSCNGNQASSPSGIPTPIGNESGSKTVPSTTWQTSIGSSTKLAYSLLILVLFIGTFATNVETI